MFFTSARCTRYHLSSPQSFSRLKSPFDVDRMQPVRSLLPRSNRNTRLKIASHRHCCQLFAENSLGPLSLIFRSKHCKRTDFDDNTQGNMHARESICNFCSNSLLESLNENFCREVKKKKKIIGRNVANLILTSDRFCPPFFCFIP